MIGRLVGHGLHHQSYHTLMHPTQHQRTFLLVLPFVFSLFFMAVSMFSFAESVLIKHLRASCGDTSKVCRCGVADLPPADVGQEDFLLPGLLPTAITLKTL